MPRSATAATQPPASTCSPMRARRSCSTPPRYKHVPLLQGQVREAFRNNVLGTEVVAEAADRIGVGSFVLISTDKAVNPTSVMGACKRVAEIFCQNFAASRATAFHYGAVRQRARFGRHRSCRCFANRFARAVR